MFSRPIRFLRRCVANGILRLAALVALAAFLIDWATKSWALNTVHDMTIPLGSLVLGVVRNDAFAFSSGSGLFSPALIAGARLLALLAMLYIWKDIVIGSRRYAAGTALLTAGGFGNAADLLFRDGGVVDFIGAGPFAFTWRDDELVHLTLVFNVADLAILIGLGLIAPLIQSWARTAQRRLIDWVHPVRTNRPIAIHPPD